MKVSKVIEYAKYGELKQTNIKDDDSAVLTYIQMGIIELYKRFNLSIKAEVIKTMPEVKVYDLRNTDISIVLTLLDSSGKNLEFKRTIGSELFDITQLTPKSFMFKNPIDTDIICIYKASPPEITSTDDDLDIPDDMLEALLYYVGHRGQLSMNKASNEQAPLINCWSMFERSCKDLEQRGYSMNINRIDKGVKDGGFA